MNNTAAAPALTDYDRQMIARARELAAVPGLDALRARTGYEDPALAYAAALGEARHLLDELAAVAERLAGPDTAR